MNKLRMSILLNIIFVILIAYYLYGNNEQGMSIESYIYISSENQSEDNNEIYADFYHYNGKIKDYCKNNGITFRAYETETDDFIGYKIKYNGKIYFYSGVTTAVDFIEVINGLR